MSGENTGTLWHAANTATSACVSILYVRLPHLQKLPHDTSRDLNSGGLMLFVDILDCIHPLRWNRHMAGL